MQYYTNFYKGDKMKVFISWSGETSLKVAETLKEWIPCVIQGIEPYLSSADIDKGARWSTDIAKELETADFGILCVTKDNLESPWLNFEAGALSKAVDKAKVCPFLFDLKPSDMSNTSPVLQFQMTSVNREDIYKLFQSMNISLGEASLPEERLKKVFGLSWSDIDESLKKIDSHEIKKSKKNLTDNQIILEEMLDLLRSQQMLLRNPEQLLPSDYINSIIKKDQEDLGYVIKSRVPASLLKNQSYIEKKLRTTMEVLREENENKYQEFISILGDYIECNRRILYRLGLHRSMPAGARRTLDDQLDLNSLFLNNTSE